MRALLQKGTFGLRSRLCWRCVFWAAPTIPRTAPGILVAASKFEPGPGPKSQTRTYKADGKTIMMVATTINADGKELHIEYAGAYDGKDYPVTGNPRVETIAQERIDFYTVKTRTKRGGKVTATTTRVVSQDGKTIPAPARTKKAWHTTTRWYFASDRSGVDCCQMTGHSEIKRASLLTSGLPTIR